MRFRLAQLAVMIGAGAFWLMGLAFASVDFSDSELDAIRGRDIFAATTNAACEGGVVEAGQVTLEGCPFAGDGTVCVKCRRTIGSTQLISFGLLPGTTGDVGYHKTGPVIPCEKYDRSNGECQGGVCTDYLPAGKCSNPEGNPKVIVEQPTLRDNGGT